DDPALAPAAWDRIFLGEVDQYLPDRAAYFRRLTPALAPSGFIAVSNRVVYRAAVLAAANAAGLRAVEVPAGLPASFFLRWAPPRACPRFPCCPVRPPRFGGARLRPPCGSPRRTTSCTSSSARSSRSLFERPASGLVKPHWKLRIP